MYRFACLLGIVVLLTRRGWNAQAQVVQEDSLALVALYNATDGPNWSDNTNWLAGPVSTWFGVIVSGDRVSGLNLEGNQLSGSLPTDLGDLTNLDILNLSFNGLTGAIPSELGNLTNLTQLLLFLNQLTGGIPPELGNLTNLTFLDLSNNSLTGTLPLSLTGLSMLVSFYFNNTNLCEHVDEAFQAWLDGIADLQGTGCTNVATEESAEIPAEFALEANYPNPFNPSTLIRYGLAKRAAVRLAVYVLEGRLVQVLVEGEQAAGWHEVRFEADGLPSGMYFYQVETGASRAVRSMLLLQ